MQDNLLFKDEIYRCKQYMPNKKFDVSPDNIDALEILTSVRMMLKSKNLFSAIKSAKKCPRSSQSHNAVDRRPLNCGCCISRLR